MNLIRGFKNVIGFLTIIPVKDGLSLTEISKYTFIFPFIGLLTGGTAGLICYLSKGYFPDLIVGTIGLGILLFITGLHHTDGLLDLGDGLMYKGTPREKLRVMKDNKIGTGGIVLGFIILTATLFLISHIPKDSIIASLIIAETSSKLSLLFSVGIATPAGTGIGKIFIDSFKTHRGGYQVLTGFIIGLVIAVSLGGVTGILVTASVLGVSLLLVALSTREFKGVNGDALGAIHEIVRFTSLIVILVA